MSKMWNAVTWEGGMREMYKKAIGRMISNIMILLGVIFLILPNIYQPYFITILFGFLIFLIGILYAAYQIYCDLFNLKDEKIAALTKELNELRGLPP